VGWWFYLFSCDYNTTQALALGLAMSLIFALALWEAEKLLKTK
jgi:hypothetical protein